MVFDLLKSILGNGRGAGRGERLLNVYSTLTTLPPIDFAHRVVGRRDLSDTGLQPDLKGLIDFVRSCGDGGMTPNGYELMRHLQHVKQQIRLQVADSQLSEFATWAGLANAVVVHEDGSIRDPNGAVVIDRAGRQDGEARLPHPADAWARKARCEAQLAERGLQVIPGLPPVFGANEVQWRLPAEVAGRAMALLVVASHAEHVREGRNSGLEELERDLPGAFDHLSPKEKEFLEMPRPDQRLVSRMGMRHESLELLAWALGLLPQLAFPEQVCDASRITATLWQTIRADWLRQARLLPGGEILDALDLHFRLHRLTRAAEADRRQLPVGLMPAVVFERHVALNWLVCFGNADWDDVDTPT